MAATLEILPEANSAARVREAMNAFPIQVQTAVRRAADRAIGRALTISKRIISKELGIRQADLTRPHRFGSTSKFGTGKALQKFKYVLSTGEAHLRISGRRIPVALFRFNATPLTEQRPIRVSFRGKTFIARRRGSGVSWTIGSRSNSASNAFIGRARAGDVAGADVAASGHVGVYKRLPGVKRLKIVELKGPSIPHVAETNPELQRAFKVNVGGYFNERLEHELEPLIRTGRLYGESGDGEGGD